MLKIWWRTKEIKDESWVRATFYWEEKNPEEVVLTYVEKLRLKREEAYRLSWDDKYTELCRKQNIEISKDVRFGIPMPKI